MSSSPPSKRKGSETQTVAAWHEALNSGDVERLIGLSHPDIEVGGPRGSGHGAQILREWVDRANVHLEPQRVFQRADTVVVQDAYHPTETTELAHVLLPAAQWSERAGTMTNSERSAGL